MRFQQVRCWVFPRPDPGNPYQALLGRALRHRGVETDTGPRLSPLWAASVPREDGVHLHWLEYFLISRRGGRRLGLLFSSARTLRTLTALGVLRLRRVPVVWTIHNLAPHESRHRRLERAGFRLTARLASRLHVHSRSAGARVVATLGLRDGSKLLVAPHGHYIDAYRPAIPRAAARRELGVPVDASLYVVFGVVRGYKRIPEALDAFAALDQPKARLIVAGKVADPSLGQRIEAAAERDPRVQLRLGFVPDDEVNLLLGAADAAILNYEEVFSSGAMLAALSAGTPVVAPAGGTAEEVARPPASELFEPGGLLKALRRVVSEPERRRVAALAAARSCDWDVPARKLAAAFRSPAS